MTLLLTDTPASDGRATDVRATDVRAGGTFAPRAVARATDLLRPRRDRGRRSFLQRAAMVGTALAVNPLDYVLRPGTAYAQTCGPANECSQGWTAFCCTINGGANTCPPGSYVAGWWKVSSSAFCRGEDRYVIDCNRLPQSRCSCRCASGSCDRRRVCCNNFRYGQCNQQIRGTTPVVCRVVICTPPWEWDSSCTTTVRSDERTRDHNSTCLNSPNPTEIAVVYQDLGLVGSALGSPTSEELAAPDGGSWRQYENGVITRSTAFGIVVLVGPTGLAYAALDGPNGVLGHVSGDPVDVAGGQVVPTERGGLYLAPTGEAHAVHGPIDDEYARRGGPAGWLGFPVTGVQDAPGGRSRVDFAAGWSLAHDPSTGEVRLLPADVELSDRPGEWPATAEVSRWSGDDRVRTAVRVSTESHPDGAPMAVLAASGSFPDALAGGVLAAIAGGPVLLTGGDALDSATADELVRLGVDRVVLVGGESVLSSQVERAVEDLDVDGRGVDVERLAGEGRFATAAAVSQAITSLGEGDGGADDDGGSGEGSDSDGSGSDATDGGSTGSRIVYLTSGRTFPDALTASPAAARDRAPLLLTEPGQVPQATLDELRRLDPDRIVIVGGTAAITVDVERFVGDVTGADVTRIEGPSRFDTAVAVVESSVDLGDVEVVLIATGEEFADALAAGAASTALDAALLLVTENSVPGVTRRAIERISPQRVVVVGGAAAVSEQAYDQLAAIPVGGSTGTDPDPSPTPTDEPTTEPTAEPTDEPTGSPTPEPAPSPGGG